MSVTETDRVAWWRWLLAVPVWASALLAVGAVKAMSHCSAFGGRCSELDGGFDSEMFGSLLVPGGVIVAGVLFVTPSSRRTIRYTGVAVTVVAVLAALLSFG